AASFVKIGLELYVGEGPYLVRELADQGERVMLDLKLHDIPATVTAATRRVAALGAELLTVHAAGGRDMLAACVDAAREASGGRLRVLAVTVLTSLDAAALADVGVTGGVADVVVQRARVAAGAGCHGVVASPLEAAAIRAALGPELLI